MKYRKKPIVIEAVKYYGDDVEFKESPEWLKYAIFKTHKIRIDLNLDDFGYLKKENQYICKVQTLEGDMIVNKGDYIIKGINGELYPCKPDIFKKTYERIE